MPGMDGFRFVGLFRSLPLCELVPVIALSGYTGSVIADRARAAGINHYLVKPADPEHLRQLLAIEVAPLEDWPSQNRATIWTLDAADMGSHCNAAKRGRRGSRRAQL